MGGRDREGKVEAGLEDEGETLSRCIDESYRRALH